MSCRFNSPVRFNSLHIGAVTYTFLIVTTNNSMHIPSLAMLAPYMTLLEKSFLPELMQFFALSGRVCSVVRRRMVSDGKDHLIPPHCWTLTIAFGTCTHRLHTIKTHLLLLPGVRAACPIVDRSASESCCLTGRYLTATR